MTGTPTDPTDAFNRRARRRDRLGIWIAWTAIAISTSVIIYSVFRSNAQREQQLRDAESGLIEGNDNPQIAFAAKYAFGMKHAASAFGTPTPIGLSTELRKNAKTRADQLRVVPLLAELDGKNAALAELDRLFPSPLSSSSAAQATGEPGSSPLSQPATQPASTLLPAAVALRKLYTDGLGALSVEQRERLPVQLGWTGRLAITFDLPEDHPQRKAMVREATTFTSVFVGIVILVLISSVLGLVLLILAMVLLSNGKLRLRYSAPELSNAPGTKPSSSALDGNLPMPWTTYRGPIVAAGGMVQPPALPPVAVLPTYPSPPGAAHHPDVVASLPTRSQLGPVREPGRRTGPFLEAFAIYVAGQVSVSALLRYLLTDYSLAWNFAVLAPVLLALAWPRIRGVRSGDYRHGFGWTAPAGLLREIGSGIAGYVAGLPVFIVGVVMTVILTQIAKASPSHPIVGQAGGGLWQTLLLFALASVWAPVVEETFFRGALFHHLRTRWGWLLSAVISSLIFAFVHPQGWTLVPGLAALAIVFCAIREWRGSNIGGMVAHALHNGTLVAIMVLAAGGSA